MPLALLPEKVLLVTVAVALLRMGAVLLPEKVLPVTVRLPKLAMPPRPVLAETMLFVTVAVPALRMAAPPKTSQHTWVASLLDKLLSRTASVAPLWL